MAIDIYERLQANCGHDRTDVAIVITADVRASGGSGMKVAPPSYPVPAGAEHPYVIEKRNFDGEVREVVLLDSYQAQANRCEEALLWARDAGEVVLPLFSLETTVSTPVGDRPVRLTSLEMPHRYADAYLRDSEVDGKSFDASEIGKPFRLASLDDATALFEREPYSIIYGAWDSHRKGRQAKFPRVYQSTTIGFDPEVGVRKGGRLDPLNLTGLIDKTTTGGDWTFTPDGEKTKGNRLSEIGHGNALDSGGAHGWVTISGGRRMAEVSFAALERVRFGAADDETSARARAALAALALLGDRLAFAKPSWFFRSGCDLVPVRETLAWERAGGELEEFLLDRRAAIALFQHAVEEAKKAGMEMAADVVTLTPRKGLRDAIEHAYVAAEASE